VFQRAPRWAVIAEETAFLLVFGIFALIRAFNPDIFWSESSMDMSFLTSLMRTHYMPPPDVWFAGTTVNYYYYGHMIIAFVAHIAGVPPQFAYNLGMATAPGIVGLAIFSTLYHLTRSKMAGALGILVAQFMGNLDATLFLVARWVSAVVHHPTRLREDTLGRVGLWLSAKVAPENVAPESLRSLAQFGFFEIKPNNWHFRFFRSAHEVISSTVHEFPFWTCIFMDLHAHLLVMPLACTLFFLESFILARGAKEARDWSLARRMSAVAVLGLGVSILIPTNSWDFPIHILIIPAVMALGAWWPGPGWCLSLAPLYGSCQALARRLGSFLGWVVLPSVCILLLAMLYARPHFNHFYRTGMGIGFLPGNFPRTGVGPFLTVHLFFLLVLAVTGLLTFVQHGAESGWTRKRLVWNSTVLVLALAFSVPATRFAGHRLGPWPAQWADILCQRVTGMEMPASPRHPGLVTAMSKAEGLEAKMLRFMVESGLYESLTPMPQHPLPSSPETRRSWMHWASYFLRLNDLTSMSLLAPLMILSVMLVVLRRGRSREGMVFDCMALTALGLIAMVEVVFVKDFYQGGIMKRFNTVFKFYLQAWNLLSIACAGKLYLAWRGWRETRRVPFCLAWMGFGSCLFVFCLCMVFVPMGLQGRRHRDTYGRVKLPPTLDGWAFMREREQDEWAGIRWFWENVSRDRWPPPVILEATGKDYDYRIARISSHTGLPTLIGWWSHVSQRDYTTSMNRLYPGDAEPFVPFQDGRKKERRRVPLEPVQKAVLTLYESLDLNQVLDLLVEHRVEYIYVGKTEQETYDAVGLRKFDKIDGQGPWNRVFQQGRVSIYQVNPNLTTAEQRESQDLKGLARLGMSEEERERIEDSMAELSTQQEDHRKEILEKTPPKNMFAGGRGEFRGQFDEPRGIACSLDGRIYVADFRNHRVQCFDEEGRFLLDWGEGKGSKPNQFNDPCAIVVTREGWVAVADTFNDRIQLFDRDGRFLRTWSTAGHPRGLAMGPNGLLLVSCAYGCVVQAFDLRGELQYSWGEGRGSGEKQFDRPQGIVCGPDGSIYVADTHNRRIKRIALNSEVHENFRVDLWNGPKEHRLEPYLALVPGKGLLCTDPTQGDVVLLDQNSGVVRQRWTLPELRSPMGIIYTVSGKVFVADSETHRIVRLAPVEEALAIDRETAESNMGESLRP